MACPCPGTPWSPSSRRSRGNRGRSSSLRLPSVALACAAIGLAAAFVVRPIGGAHASEAPAVLAQVQAPAPPKGKSAAKSARPSPKKPQMPTQPQVETAPESSGETLQIDLSSRSIPIESDFSGARLILFGAVENSKQMAPEAGLYDIVVAIEGPAEKISVRCKARSRGIWINTRAITLQEVPSYYAIISTRPLEEIASGKNLDKIQERHEIGFQHVYMEIAPGQGRNPAANELDVFKEALIRLKQREGLYREIPGGELVAE